MCDQPLKGDSVWDHCNITGNYRDYVHSKCNLKLRIDLENIVIGPVVVHILREYDSQLIMQANAYIEEDISCVSNNTKKEIP